MAEDGGSGGGRAGGNLPFRAYTRAERLADAVIHALGITGALVAVPVLVTLAADWHGEATAVAAALVYGVSLIAMFAFSAAYHMTLHPPAKEILRRFDRATIFVMIAGTYTPFAVLLGGEDTLRILGVIWTGALCGLAIEVVAPRRFEPFSLALCMAMGWAILAIGGPILESVTGTGFRLMLAGGLLYTVGVVFHLWSGLRYQNAIWHGFVLAASFLFYAAIVVEVRASSPVP